MGTARLSWLIVTLTLTLTLPCALGACTEVDSPTDLFPEGPPMVRQVFLRESIPIGSGMACMVDANCTSPSERCFDNACQSPGLFQGTDTLSYGAHPQASAQMKHRAVRAAALGRNQTIRVVMDELLVGNYLEKIACRGPVDDDGAYSFVPLGTTPDDIAGCAAPADVLPETCKGDHAVCIDKRNAAPCVNGECGPGLSCVDEVCGIPVGILDEAPQGGDLAADDTQFIAGAAGVRCIAGPSTIEVPMSVQESYWQPSGNQQVPATGGFSAVGPAVVLKPLDGLPTGRRCTVYFAGNIVDKGNNQVCAPVYGAAGAPDDGVWPPAAPCTPGNTDDVEFTVEPLVVTSGPTITAPLEGQIDYPTFSPIVIEYNAKMDLASFGDATLTPAPPMAPTITRGGSALNTITISIPGGLAPTTTYTLSLPSAADVFGGTLSVPLQVTFTTGT